MLIFLLGILGQPGTPDWTQFTAVLAFLAGPVGAVFAANWIAGNFLEKMAWWAKMPKWVKWTVPPVFAIALSILVQQIDHIPGLAEIIQPYWGLIVSIIIGYFGSQLAHTQTRKSRQVGRG